ncbi:cytochrome d ubiquinol oxidase subunit II [Catenovulum sp. 2E275]|uniref:cytochrome d ubiquinol oxidase subunit II n=1 Tax=Catenovulum sp. 2E275 TaxID=2980497 RepID=UPI0021CE74A5|nr:cytochrome d ubiquinol oxidase subunit II [Catenovulum sp. 2E275]MCU4676623.1 cytochrome d ubiquinol oxidase subunit II [Catenovulum sp. 2E275]
MFSAETLAVIFVGLMGLSILLYAILDGYDLGVGILLPLGNQKDSDDMIASIGPFWDANETWLVMAVGVLLIAFPSAHSFILKELYLPVAVLLIALILRGVAFDFRVKAAFSHRPTWDKAFKAGSVLAALSQGYMLGMYIMGFEHSWQSFVFSGLSALGVVAAYSYIGACWLVMKSEGSLQKRAAKWARKAGRFSFIGVLAVSIVNPIINPDVFERWFSLPNMILLLPMPAFCFVLFLIVDRLLKRMPFKDDASCWIPFVGAIMIFFLCFNGLAFSFFPDIVPGKINIWQAAAAPESLSFILWGAMIVIPCILAYTVYSYRVFWGKTKELRYY